jgi:hypothetical protein
MSISSTSASEATRSLYQVPLLNANNFTTWKYRMELILKSRRMWKYVDGSAVAPNTRDTADVKREYEENDQLAHSQIVLTVSDSVISHLRTTTTAKDAWVKICSVFEQKGLAAKVFLRRKLLNLKKEASTPMQEHINTVRDLAEQLSAIGSPISDGDLAITLLCSLSDAYDPIIISLESRDPKDITFDLIAARLLAEELRQKESVGHEMTSTEKAESALLAKRSSNGFRSSKVCTHCKRPGHSEMNCWDKHGKPGQSKDPFANPAGHGPYVNYAFGF